MDARSRNGSGEGGARDKLEQLAGDRVGGIKAKVERIRKQQAQEEAERRERDMNDAAKVRGVEYIHGQLAEQLGSIGARLDEHAAAAESAKQPVTELDLGVVLLSDRKIRNLFPNGKIDKNVVDEKVRGVHQDYQAAAKKLEATEPKAGRGFGERLKAWGERGGAEKAVDAFKGLDTNESELQDSGNMTRLRHEAEEHGFRIERRKEGPFVRLVAVPMTAGEKIERLLITDGDEIFNEGAEAGRTYTSEEVEALLDDAYDKGAEDKSRELGEAAKLEKLQAKIERMEEERALDHKWMDKMIALMGSGRGADAEALKTEILREVRDHLKDHESGAA
jgi:hypothetical protein